MKIKQLFLSAIITLSVAFGTHAQVKVGSNPTTIDASSVLEAESNTKGFLPPRMTTAQQTAIVSPAKGLILYNTTLDCLQINKGTPAAPTWECIGASAAPTATVDCNATAFAGTYVSGTAMSGTNNYVVTVVNNSLSPVSVAMQSTDLVLSGVAGLAVGTPTPATLSLAGGASGTVSYPITGNPTACGTLTGVWTKISLTCTKTVVVNPSNFILPATSVTYNATTGEVSGFTANWTAQSGATAYTVERSTSASGPWTAFASNPYAGTSAAVTGLAGNNSYWLRITLQNGTCAGAFAISGPVASTAKSCNDYNLANPSSTDGVYAIDIDGTGSAFGVMQAQCDMTTDGGGWTLVTNYVHQAGTSPATVARSTFPLIGSSTLGANEGGNTTFWGTTSFALNSAMTFTSIRARAITDVSSSVFHRKWTDAADVTAFKTLTSFNTGGSAMADNNTTMSINVKQPGMNGDYVFFDNGNNGSTTHFNTTIFGNAIYGTAWHVNRQYFINGSFGPLYNDNVIYRVWVK